MKSLLAEEYNQRRESVPPYEVRITSFRLGETYYCTVDNISQGAIIARTEGKTLREVETTAMTVARELLDKVV
ncbi:MAG TPA: hypothetical protein VII11_01140 [Bacteroidota bacterium]